MQFMVMFILIWNLWKTSTHRKYPNCHDICGKREFIVNMLLAVEYWKHVNWSKYANFKEIWGKHLYIQVYYQSWNLWEISTDRNLLLVRICEKQQLIVNKFLFMGFFCKKTTGRKYATSHGICETHQLIINMLLVMEFVKHINWS